MMALHILTTSGLSPAIEFLLELLIGRWRFFWHEFLNLDCQPLAGERVAGTAALRLCYIALLMTQTPQSSEQNKPKQEPFYCPQCSQEVADPLTCGDCSAVICRRCGTPLELPDELGMG